MKTKIKVTHKALPRVHDITHFINKGNISIHSNIANAGWLMIAITLAIGNE